MKRLLPFLLALLFALPASAGVTLCCFGGFENDDTAEISAWSQYDINNTAASGTTHGDLEDYVIQLGYFQDTGGYSYFSSPACSSAADQWFTVGVWAYFSGGVDGNADMDFIEVGDTRSTADIIITIYNDGAIRLKDANGSTVNTYDFAVQNGYWYLFELKYNLKNTGAVSVLWINGTKLGLEVAQDFLNSSASNDRILTVNGARTDVGDAGDVGVVVDSWYMQYDDGAGIYTYHSNLGRFSVHGPYNDDSMAQYTSDFGSSLNSGYWPPSGTGAATYTNTGNSEGGVSSDGGSNLGPKDETGLDLYKIAGADWIASFIKTGSGSQSVKPKYGADGSASNDSTSYDSTITLTTSAQYWRKYVDASDGNCPARDSEYFQFGMQKQESGPLKGNCRCLYWTSYLLLQDPRKVNIDGSVQLKERK